MSIVTDIVTLLKVPETKADAFCPDKNFLIFNDGAIKAELEASVSGPEDPLERPREADRPISTDKKDMVFLLIEELNRLNSVFLEQQDSAINTMQILSARLVQAVNDPLQHQKIQSVGQSLTNFHGELVLLLHCSLVNMSAVLKILKEQEKTSDSEATRGACRSLMQSLSQQPFCCTRTVSYLVAEAETLALQASRLAAQTCIMGLTGSPQCQDFMQQLLSGEESETEDTASTSPSGSGCLLSSSLTETYLLQGSMPHPTLLMPLSSGTRPCTLLNPNSCTSLHNTDITPEEQCSASLLPSPSAFCPFESELALQLEHPGGCGGSHLEDASDVSRRVALALETWGVFGNSWRMNE